MKTKNIYKTSFIALFAAIICVGCFIKIPLGVVPIVLQNAICILTGVILGGILGGVPTALFLVAGLIGLPVYSGGSSGVAVWMGPTGGFLPGYLIGAIVAAIISGKPSVEEKKLNWKIVLKITIAMTVGMIILYIPGVFHFASWAAGSGKVPLDKSSFSYTMTACVLPYIPGDLIKIAICVPIALKIRPLLAQYINNDK